MAVKRFGQTFLLMLLVAGCDSSKDLSRSKAVELLKKTENFNIKNQMHICTGKNIYPFAAHFFLQKAGYIVGWRAGPNPTDISLTPKGESASKSWVYEKNSNCWRAVLATREFLEVTGIRQEGTEALVEYTWKWNWTPLADDLRGVKADLIDGLIYEKPGTIHKDKWLFRRYDDGWRMGN